MMTWNSMFFNSPFSVASELVVSMHDYVMLFLFSIFILVFLNMSFLLISSNFSLSFFESHQLETIWTLVPFVIILFIVFPSLVSLYMLDSCFFCGLGVIISGHQWYWSYSYSDSEMNFDSYMLPSSESSIRLLDVDNRLILPSQVPVRFVLTSLDVIHSWTIPSLGVKMDAAPGRLNQFCITTKRSGIFFGQCSEICGANHSFMPIVMEAVSSKFFVPLMLEL